MRRKILPVLLVLLLAVTMTACGGADEEPAAEEETTVEAVEEDAENEAEPERVDLGTIPEGCVFVPADQHRAACDILFNLEWPSDPVTMDQMVEAFGTEGIYYENSDREEYGITYKTYAWFSEEDWGNTKVAIAITFQVDPDTSDLIYYSYVYQGDDW